MDGGGCQANAPEVVSVELALGMRYYLRTVSTGTPHRPRPFVTAAVSLLVVAVLGVIFNGEGAFFQWETHRDMLRQVSVFGVLACGATIVIVSGGIDLAVGSILALCAVLFSILTIGMGWGAVPSMLVTAVAGILCGALSGGLIARFTMQPFVATLAMMVFARGVAKLLSGGQKISTAVQESDGTFRYVDVPGVFEALNAKTLGDNLAVVTIVMICCLAACWGLLSHTAVGRAMYAVGGNEEAARLSGIRVGPVKVLAYSLSGLLCAVAGMCQAAQEQQGDPETGATYELTAIAMVVIGGTSLRGGEGSLGRTAFGILTIGYLEKILSINAVGEETRLMLTGLVIVVAVLAQHSRAGTWRGGTNRSNHKDDHKRTTPRSQHA
ncbi:MAG: rbsC [Bacteroidetes bacterium]|nr:rbsC [Bacteroidota bacterium]